jgi:lipoate-protein ligase A
VSTAGATRWRLVADDGSGAAEGLAFDEAVMAGYARGAHPRPPTLRLYTYDTSALCGRYQHLEAEIDVDACRRTGTPFNRRPTGGGAIVMGPGQLGVAVVGEAPVAEHPKAVLERLSQGIVAGLAKLGIEAVFAGKNDLKTAGRKIAGLGLYLDGAGGMLFHSSVLADLDIAFMLEVLDIPAAKLGDLAVAAVEERVTTVSRETGERWTGASLREVVALGFAEALGVELVEAAPDDAERARADELVASKYSRPEWLFQRSPRADATASSVLKTPGGLVRLYLALQGDTIKSALFTGDFNEIPEPLSRFEERLKWARLERGSLERLAVATCPDGTGLGVEADVLVDAVLQAGERAATRVGTGEVAAPDRPGSCYFPEAQ